MQKSTKKKKNANIARTVKQSVDIIADRNLEGKKNGKRSVSKSVSQYGAKNLKTGAAK